MSDERDLRICASPRTSGADQLYPTVAERTYRDGRQQQSRHLITTQGDPFTAQALRAFALPRAVVGGAPDGTAVVELTLAGGDDAERALRTFASAADSRSGRRASPRSAASRRCRRSSLPTRRTEVSAAWPRSWKEVAGSFDIVQVPSDQTLEEFTERFASAVPIEQLAIINHLPDGSARLNAGTLVKRVVS